MRYRLRTLLIALSLGPPLLAVSWSAAEKAIAKYQQRNTCSDHLRQIGVALHNYSSVFSTLPPGARWRNGPYPEERESSDKQPLTIE